MAAAQYYEEVQQAYLAYYGRPADTAGMAYWANQLNNAGGDLNSIINAFGTSAESTALYGGSNTAAQITAIYQTLFGRQPDTAGLNFYVNGIATGQFTLASVALNVYYGATGTDATALTAKLAYADAFTAALEASGSAQVAYSGTAASNNARAAVATVVDTVSEAAAAANLSTMLTNISAGAVGQTVTLTTGVDHITLTGNNNVVNGTLGVASFVQGATLTSGDSVIGAANSTGNTLNIAAYNNDATITMPVGVTLSNIQNINVASNGGGLGADAVGQAFDVSGVTGLQNLTVVSAGADFIKAATTTNVTDTSVSGSVITGGNSVNVTTSGVVQVSGAAGAVTVNDAATAGSSVIVQGGSSVNVTAASGSVTVEGVPTAALTPEAATTSVTVNDAKLGAGTITVLGGSDVTITASGVGSSVGGHAVVIGGTDATGVTNAPAGAVNVTSNAVLAVGATANDVVVNGGTTITVNETATTTDTSGASVTNGSVEINGSSATTTVTVHQNVVAAVAPVAANPAVPAVPAVPTTAGFDGSPAVPATPATAAVPGVDAVLGNAVTITDAGYATNAAGTITSVTLTNFGNTSTINDNALTSLSLTGGTGTLTLNNNLLTTQSVTQALALNSVGTAAAPVAIVDTAGEVTTLNVALNGASNATLAYGGVTTLNVSGSGSLNGEVDSTVQANLTTLNVSGSAGFNDGHVAAATTGLASYGSALTINVTSSGTFVAELDATSQTFTGSTGQDIITIAADATKAIAGGSAGNNELILDAAGATFTAANTGANVTGFETLGVTTNATGTVDMSVFTGSQFTAIDVVGSSGVTFDKVAVGTTVTFDTTTTGTVELDFAGSKGASDTANVVIGSGSNDAIVVSGLTLDDQSGNGIATVNVVSNGDATNTGNTLHLLGDSGLTTLGVSGSVALAITGGIEIPAAGSTGNVSGFTLNNTDTATAGVSIDSLTLDGSHINSVTFAGTGATTIDSLITNGTSVALQNTGSGVATVSTLTDDGGITSLTLAGKVALGANDVSGTAGSVELASATGVTVSGATDNAHVNLLLDGAAYNGAATSAVTDTVTLGNGNNFVTDHSVSGTVNITVGTGYNLIDLSSGGGATDNTGTAGAGTYSATVTLGAHTDTTTAFDEIKVGTLGASVTAPNTTIKGVVAGDVIDLTGFAGSAKVETLSAAQQHALSVVNGTTGATFADAVAAIGGVATGGDAIAFQFHGNTYVVVEAAANTLATGDTAIELVGTHTITGNAAAGHFTIAS